MQRELQLTNRRALTQLDLLITVLIIGIMSAVGIPRFAAVLHQRRVTASAERIRADLEMARQNAIASSVNQGVQFTPGSESYSLLGIDSLDHPGQPYAVDLKSYPYHSQIISATLGGDAAVQFDRYGKPDSGGVVTVQCGSTLQTVSLDAETGRATIP